MNESNSKKQPEPFAVLRGHEHEIHAIHFLNHSHLLSGFDLFLKKYIFVYLCFSKLLLYLLFFILFSDSIGNVFVWKIQTRRILIERKIHSKGIVSLNSNQFNEFLTY